MTKDQQYNRDERIGMMIADNGLSEIDAQKYCDCFPDVYGIRDIEEKQDNLI